MQRPDRESEVDDCPGLIVVEIGMLTKLVERCTVDMDSSHILWGYNDMRPDFRQADRVHAIDLEELVCGDEAAETRAVFHNAPCKDRTYASEQLKTARVCCIDIDL